LRLHDAQLNISHSFLGWNRAHRNGGAVLVGTHETYKSLNSTLRLVNTTFDTNTAEATGGGDASVMATVVSVRNLANVSIPIVVATHQPVCQSRRVPLLRQLQPWHVAFHQC
jgi:hypothetical protein